MTEVGSDSDSIKPGDLLPPVRQLALDLGVHFNTVALAYRMLAAEGWLELKRRRGAAVIARNAPRAVDRRQVDHLLRQLGQIAAELRSVGMSWRAWLLMIGMMLVSMIAGRLVF